MEVRPIDGNELLGIERLLDTDVVRQSKTASWLLDQVLDDIQTMPTLPQPSNEALTLEELRGMDGEPVFLVFMQPIEYGWEDQWALVNCDNETVFNGTYRFNFADCVGFAYRRPPEGEA